MGLYNVAATDVFVCPRVLPWLGKAYGVSVVSVVLSIRAELRNTFTSTYIPHWDIPLVPNDLKSNVEHEKQGQFQIPDSKKGCWAAPTGEDYKT
ncbi:hypothetical protein CFP56_009858, partial [Quercus suber]